MTGVVLISRDWQFRALLRAQLLEEGCHVRGFESIANLDEELKGTAFKPGLIIADLSGADLSRSQRAEELEHLAAWTGRAPVWIIMGRGFGSERELEPRGFEAVIFRPVAIRELVDRIKQRMGDCGPLVNG